jgi:hypothetical protein
VTKPGEGPVHYRPEIQFRSHCEIKYRWLDTRPLLPRIERKAMQYVPSEEFCLGFMLIGAAILMTGLVLPLFTAELRHDPDVIISGSTVFGISVLLYSLARSKRKQAK